MNILTEKLSTEAVRSLAEIFVEEGSGHTEYQCSGCLQSADARVSAYSGREAAVDALTRLFEHCAFEHATRCDVLKVETTARFIWS